MDETKKTLFLGETITVQTMRGRGDQIISRLPDGRVALFDKDNRYFNLLAPGQSVECHITFIHENYIIVNPISEPEEIDEEIEVVYLPEVEVDDIVEDLKRLIKTVPKNAKVIPKALLRVIQLEQLIIKILRGES